MRTMKFVAMALLASVKSANVDYKTNGDNWPKLDGECKTGTQSPIDLSTSVKQTDANT